jgi:NAD(P)-dependent dehydrogenase (short-subunit alcohol dehydrogenase family)
VNADGTDRGRDVADLARLDGRVAIVTGGAGHIGRVVADALAEQGAATAIVDLDAGRCDDVAADISERRRTPSVGVAADLADDESARSVAPAVEAAFGRIDVLCHVAALVSAEPLPNWTTPFDDQGVDVWRRALDVNLTAVFVVTQACAPALRAGGHGSVIVFGSTYGVVGPDWRVYAGTDMGNAAGYAASKGGAIQLGRWLATTLAPEVRVNALTPGGVARGQPQSFQDAYAARTPLGRMATEEDYKGAAVFLASDLSRYVTGHNLVVDGGWTAW